MVWSDVVNGKVDNSNTNSNLSSVNGKTDAKDKSTLDVNDFLKLLVAQMQYQDPLEPTDNTQYIAQMATFTQVEATAQMNNKIEQQMASSLVGKCVIMATNLTASGMIAGKVDYWETIDGTVYLGIGGKLYDVADLDTVMDDEYFNQFIQDPDTDDTTGGTDGTQEPDGEEDSGSGDGEQETA